MSEQHRDPTLVTDNERLDPHPLSPVEAAPQGIVEQLEPRATTLLANKLPLLPKTLAQLPLGTPTTAAPTSPLRDTIPWRIVLHIGDALPTAVGLEVTDSIMMGRTDSSANYCPHLDLTTYGALEAGVSRRHARLFIHDRGLYIQDCSSTNGTRVNTHLLKPETPYKLSDGDLIEMGDLHIRLNILRSAS